MTFVAFAISVAILTLGLAAFVPANLDGDRTGLEPDQPVENGAVEANLARLDVRVGSKR